ncbi:hypothetical protein FKP32DRAFT_413968 [Trametes sanguinea]|nr:hypothetical protein FKP32DRAFT_413968 [Trametes sanguinea]
MAYMAAEDGYYSNAYHQMQAKQSVPISHAPPSPTRNLQERQAPHVPPPATHIPTDEEFFVFDPHTGRNRPNVEYLRQHFFHEGRISHQHALFILEQATDLMSREPNLLAVPSPVTVCGDIHGQYVRPSRLFLHIIVLCRAV